MTTWIDRLEPLRHRAAYLLQRYRRDRCHETAAALTYMSLFALVPLMTVLYTMASAIPTFQGLEASIQALIFENLVPETSAGLQEYIRDFSRQAKNLSGFGIAFLILTAVLMLRSIEQAFNLIWRTDGNRSAVSSFLLYWAVLSLTPVTIGLGLGVSAFLNSFAGYLEQWDIIGIGALILGLLPFVLEVLGFTLVYAAVPNCRVPLRHAFVGGIIAAVSFNIARSLFTELVAGSSITFIYGAFAAVPLFLLWIYISWNVVLLSATLVHSLSAYQSAAKKKRPMLLKALELLETMRRRQADGRSLGELEVFRRGGPALDADSWQTLRDVLTRHRLIIEDDNGGYLLARDLHEISLWQLQDWLRDGSEIPSDVGDHVPAWEKAAIERLRAQRDAERDAMDISLASLFNEHGKDST